MEAKTGDDASAEGESWGDQEGAKSEGGRKAGGTGVTAGPSSGPPTVTFPGFEVMPDGKSVITVQVRGPVTVSEQKAEGRLIYVMSGVSVPEKVNRLPLLTQHFPTQVTSITMEQAAGGAQLTVDLREPAKATHRVSEREGGGSILTITLPKSEKYGRDRAPDGYERPEDVPDEDTSDAIDGADSDVPEDASEETARRRKKSKRQPKPYVMRPLTLPRATLAPDFGLSFAGRDKGTPLTYLTSGIRIGVVDQFEIEATPHSIRLSPRSGYALPSVGFTGGYTGHTFEIGGRLRYFLGADSFYRDVGPGGGVLGAPMAIHLGTWGRIDTGVFASMDFDGDIARASTQRGPALGGTGFKIGLYEQQPSPFFVDSGIPLKFLFQPDEALWFGIHHGIAIYDFELAGDTFALPLGAEIGITATDDYNPVADLGFKLSLPEFIYPGDSNDVVHENVYQVGIWFRWFHHL